MSAAAQESQDFEAAYVVDSVGEMPTTFKSAMESSDAIKWKEACDSEMESLHKNETWILVPLPKGRKAIGNRLMEGMDLGHEACMRRREGRRRRWDRSEDT
ncbi:hypothetical protein PC123_g29053 [Phytophthora cactorum]|nr:hypothetical protein PC120_g28245 [Phytophthora cactorum]KAG4029450.1 hypothetical protein PC123_g29053 [Phytophthora cactorum]